jgi:hypothetical protein
LTLGLVTSIYGESIGEGFDVTGFDPTMPEVTFLPPETFVGSSGDLFTSYLRETPNNVDGGGGLAAEA